MIIEGNYDDVLTHNFTYPDYVMHIFDALFTSKNEICCLILQMENNKWELGKEINPNVLIEGATRKYNNMVLEKIWNQTNPNTQFFGPNYQAQRP